MARFIDPIIGVSKIVPAACCTVASIRFRGGAPGGRLLIWFPAPRPFGLPSHSSGFYGACHTGLLPWMASNGHPAHLSPNHLPVRRCEVTKQTTARQVLTIT